MSISLGIFLFTLFTELIYLTKQKQVKRGTTHAVISLKDKAKPANQTMLHYTDGRQQSGRVDIVSNCRQCLTFFLLSSKVTDLRAHDKEKHCFIRLIHNRCCPFFCGRSLTLHMGMYWLDNINI